MVPVTARWPISPHTVLSVCFGIIIIIVIIILRGWKRFGWLVDAGSDDKGAVAGGLQNRQGLLSVSLLLR